MNLYVLLAFLLLQVPQDSPKERLAAVQQKLKQINLTAINELLEQADKDPDPAICRVILARLSRLRIPGVRETLKWHAISLSFLSLSVGFSPRAASKP